MTVFLRELERRGRRLFRRRFPTVRQYDSTDCGAASLLSVLRYHGGDASLVFVRELAHTGVRGASMWSLLEAARTLGFDATGARGSYSDLLDTPLPCVAHLRLEDGRPHFVVVFEVTNEKVLIGDPARGLHRATREWFCDRWQSRSVLLLSPTDRLHRTPAPHWIGWVLGFFRRENAWLTQTLFMGLAYAGLGLLTALFVRALIDRFIPSGSVRGIVVLGTGLLALQLLRGVVGFLRSWLLIELSRRVNTSMTADALRHILRLPAGFFESRRTGDITARLNDSVKIHAALLTVLGNSVIDVAIVIGSLALLFYFAPPFAWAAAGFISMLSFVVALGARYVRDHQHRVKQSYAGVQSAYIDSIKAIDPIRATNSAPLFGNLLGRMYEHMQTGLARLGMIQARISLAVELTAGVLIVLALTAGSVLVVREAITLGSLMAAYSLLAAIVPATARIFEAHLQLQEAGVASNRLLDLLLVQSEENRGTASFQMSRGLAVRGGGFSWHGGKPLLVDVDLEVPRGRLTALCGPSGAGKSTLIKILDRRYCLAEGCLYVDGTPAEDVDLASYRRHVATLPEAVSILNGTIADNVLLGREVEDSRLLLERIDTLGLDRFCNRFPHGMLTLIGEEGRQISSGERQTIGLLRALWDSPEVLLVDEGINAVDPETARHFLRTLKQYAEDHAVLVVSHHPETLLQADHVYVLCDGTIAEHGAPERLLATDSEFSSLFLDEAAIRCPA